MTHLIDKDALVAKIKRIYKQYEKQVHFEYMSTADFMCIELKKILSAIDNLEVKEIDLEKEISEYFVEHSDEFFSDKYKLIAKHFFELGLKAQKEEKI